jgi:hypothetical protein
MPLFEAEKFVDVELNLSDKDFNTLAKIAHEKDITINATMIEILEEYIKNHSDPFQESILKLLEHGITVETLKEFGDAYGEYVFGINNKTKYISEDILDAHIQDAFDIDDENHQ